MRTFLAVLLFTIVACGGQLAQPPDCAESLTSYCAKSTCVMQLPADGRDATCALADAYGVRVFDPASCGNGYVGYDVPEADDEHGFLYDGTGKLVAVFSKNARACIAGPAVVPDHGTCISTAIFACKPSP